MTVVIVAPRIAPTVVNISRNMATRTVAIFSRTQNEAERLEVAIMLAIPQAIASLTGIQLFLFRSFWRRQGR